MIYSKLVLDKRRLRSDSTYRITLRVTYKRTPLLIGSDYCVSESEWDEENGRIKPDCKRFNNLARVNNSLEKFRINAEQIIDLLTLTGEIDKMSPAALRNRIVNKNKAVSFRDFNDKIIKELEMSNKLGNASCYIQAQRFLDRYSNQKDLSFEDIDFKFLKSMEAMHLSKNNSLNSLSFYLRTVRAVFNRAIHEGVIRREIYPFDKYSIKETKTKKRAIRKNDINLIRDLKIDENTPMWHARNYFMFSFYCIGMNFADMANLKRSNIIKGRIEYVRAKTGKPYSVKLVEPAIEIINLYFNGQGPKDYVFPIIKREDPALRMKDLQNERKTYNKYLKHIAAACGIEANLTSYVARHSWATIAKDLNQPISVISEGLGHEDSKTTQIYLDSFDDEVIDNANELVTG